MTLKGRFEEVQDAYHDRSDECVIVAEEFAINFANWYHFMLEQTDNLNKRFTPKELIEMFKKERDL
jgi:hypothetical protein